MAHLFRASGGRAALIKPYARGASRMHGACVTGRGSRASSMCFRLVAESAIARPNIIF
jgi:hypothetical protein